MDKLHGMDRINRIVASCMEEVIYLFSIYNQKIVAGKLKEMRENHTKPWNTSLLKYLEIFLRIDEICPQFVLILLTQFKQLEHTKLKKSILRHLSTISTESPFGHPELRAANQLGFSQAPARS